MTILSVFYSKQIIFKFGSDPIHSEFSFNTLARVIDTWANPWSHFVSTIQTFIIHNECLVWLFTVTRSRITIRCLLLIIACWYVLQYFGIVIIASTFSLPWIWSMFNRLVRRLRMRIPKMGMKYHVTQICICPTNHFIQSWGRCVYGRIWYNLCGTPPEY